MNELVKRAKDLAYRAHAGQVDKAGRPYIEHVARVAAAVRKDLLCPVDDCENGEPTDWRASCGNPECCPWRETCPVCDEAEAVAWLHDVLEDCDDSFRVEIVDGFPERIYRACCWMDRNRSYGNAEYHAVIRSNRLALRVKLADIADNADEARLALLDEKTAARLRRKYAKARKALGQ
jgi:(p)ppGpp synthase/HD superfamily hydrolase